MEKITGRKGGPIVLKVLNRNANTYNEYFT